MATWTNNDGLPIEFGITRASPGTGGEPDQAGESRKLIIDFDLADLGDANAAIGFVDKHELPEGAIIHRVRTIVLEDADGTNATLDIGVIKQGTEGTDDPDGFDEDIPETTLDNGKGTTVECDGALIGTALDANYYFSASYETAAFTAGRVRVIIEYTPTLNRYAQTLV